MIPAVGDRIDYAGKSRQVIGHLRYPAPPEPGAIVGPNGWGEKCVVLGTVDGVTLIGRAIVSDIEAATDRIAVSGGSPVSLHEIRAHRVRFNDQAARSGTPPTRSDDIPQTRRQRSPGGR